jgi:hypothetical protein
MMMKFKDVQIFRVLLVIVLLATGIGADEISGDQKFLAAEDGVFEEGITPEIRRARLDVLLNMIPFGWDATMRHLRCEGVYQRLVKEFPGDWWACLAAAKFLEEVPGLAVIQEGKWVRRLDWSGSTHHAAERDRVERIRLLMKAQELALPEYRNGSVSGDDLAEILLELSLLFQRREGDRQLTDLEVVPELELISQRWLPGSWSGKIKQFVMPSIPASFEESRTDDERALWCLELAGKFAESRKVEVKYEKADFWADTLGVHLVAYQGFIYVEGTESEFDAGAPGEFELHTLKDSETLVMGKDGPERITLPEHCRYLSMLREVIEDPSASAELRWRSASDLIEWLYPNRRQFEKAVELAKRMDQLRGKGSEEDQQDESDFDGEIPGPEMEVGGERFFVKGKEPQLTVYSRMMQKANLEIWKLDPEKLGELNTYGNHGPVALELRADFLGNTNYDDEDIREEHAWFEKIFDLERRWEVPLRMKPQRLQSATVVKVPVSEPGTYAVVEKTKDGRSVYPFRIYDLVLMKAGWKNSDLYVIDPSTGEAFEGAEVLATEMWDDDLHFVSDHTGRLQAVGDYGDLGRSFLIRRPGGEWQVGMILNDGPGTFWDDYQIWQSFLVTSQPLYRPGQKVSLAGWLKHVPRWRVGKEETLKDVGVRMKVTDPTGREVWSGETKLDEFGGFTGEFQLRDEVVLGDYRIQLQAEGFFSASDPFADPFAESEDTEPKKEWQDVESSSRWHRGWHFEVGEIRKPDFQVKLIPVEGGGEFELMVEATYLSGEPVRGAPVIAGLEGTPALMRFHPKRKWDDLFEPGYQWSLRIPRQMPDWKSWAIWPGDSALSNDYDGQDYEVTTRLEAVTDDEGRARLKFDANFPFLDQFPYRVTVKAGVIEMTGRRVGARKSWVHTGLPFEVFARPLEGFYHEGDEVEIEVGMMSVGGEPRSGRGVLKLERIEDGEFKNILRRELEIDERGVAKVSIIAPRGGQYRCVFAAGGSERGFVMEVMGGEVVRRKDSYFVMIGREIWNGYHPPELPSQGGSGFPITPATPSLYAYSRAGGAELNDEEFGLVDQVKARSKFTDRAYWGGALKTGRDGRLKVAFDLPENLTTWRLQSWAFGKGRAFGEAQLELPVSKKLQVRPMLPRAAVVGDELVIGAIVQNLSEIKDDFILTLEVEGMEVKDAGAREVSLKAGAEGIAQWRVVMKEAGAALVRVKVVGRESKLSDGFEHRVPVAAKEIQQTVSGAVRVEAGSEEVVLESPGDPGMEDSVVTVRAEANSAVSALLVLPDLVRYPYGCVEQTLSRFLPLMIASKAAGDLGLEWSEMARVFKKRDHSLVWLNGRQATELGEVELKLSEEKVADMISVGIHRLDELQRNDGSWGWFSAKDEEARVDMTALALRGLLMADAKGRDGRQLYAIERGVRWLEKWSELEISEKTEVRTLAEAAFVAWVLREAESKKVDELITKLSKVLAKLPTTSKIHLALAMKKSPGLEVVVGEIREEMKRVVQPGYRSWWNAEVERRAYYLKLLVEIGADATELNAEVERLLESRTDGVRWRHTRESALCVEAIIEAMLAQGRDFSNEEEEHRVTIFGPGGEREIVLSKANLWTESIELPLSDDWKKGLSIRAKNAGAEGVRVAASTCHPTSDTKLMQASEDGLKLERNYYSLSQGGGRILISEDEKLKVGEVIQVVLVVSTDVPREFLHVRDAIPAGLEQLNQLSGYRSGAFQQSRTGEAHFFLNNLEMGERRLSYTVNVVTEGRSLALPAQVECMYAPDFRGQSGARRIEVRR